MFPFVRVLGLVSSISTLVIFSSLAVGADEEDDFLLLQATCQDVYDLFEDASPGDDKDAVQLAKAQDDVLYLVVWVHGYLSGRNGIDLEKRPLGEIGIKTIVAEMDTACEPDATKRFIDVVKSIQ
jgi:hypothetical protein